MAAPFARTLLFAWLFLAQALFTHAQEPTAAGELLSRVPDDFGVCLVINDLRGNWERLRSSPWLAEIKKSSLVQSVLQSPEIRHLKRFEEDLKKHLDVDGVTLRDEILGSAVVFAYRPPAGKDEQESGLLLLKSRQPEKLAQLVTKLNQVQTQSGEIKAVEERKHAGVAYFYRQHKKQSHYYWLDGSLLAVAGKEATLQAIIDRTNTKESPIYSALKKTGADCALVALWMNPRQLDAEFEKQAKADLGASVPFMKSVLATWQGFDAVVFSGHWDASLELRATLVARPGDLPESVRGWFQEKPKTSDLWKRFPRQAIITIAWAQSFEKSADTLASWLPPQERRNVGEQLQKSVGALLGLDVRRDVLPNIGPDVGVSLFPAAQAKHVPQLVFALAVKHQPEETPIDQALLDLIKTMTPLALLELNRNPKVKEPIRMKQTRQGTVEVRSLVQDSFFPAGFQPAFALKDGYLLLASSPEGIAQFGAEPGAATSADETPLLRFSATALAQVLRAHRDDVVAMLAQKNNTPPVLVGASLDNVLGLLDLFDHAQLSLRQGQDYLTWALRVEPAKAP